MDKLTSYLTNVEYICDKVAALYIERQEERSIAVTQVDVQFVLKKYFFLMEPF